MPAARLRGWMPGAPRFRVVLVAGDYKELQAPTLGGIPTLRAKTEGTAIVSEDCSSWRISSRAARASLTAPQRAYSLPRLPSLNPWLLKVPDRLSRSMEFTTEQSIAFFSRTPTSEGSNQNQKI